MMSVVLAYSDIINGNWWKVFTDVFTGAAGSFAGLVFGLTAIIIVYMQTRSITPTAVLTVIIGGSLIRIMPAGTGRIAYVFIVLGVAGVLWKIFGHGGRVTG